MLPDKDQLTLELARQVLADYQRLQNDHAFLKRSLRRTEAFLEDSRRVNISQQDQIATLERERKLLIDVAYKAIAAGEKVAKYSQDIGSKEEGIQILIDLRTQLNDIEIPF